MTIKIEKTAYVAPMMTIVKFETNAQILCGSDSFGLCEEDDVDLGAIDTYGNDKA